MNKVTATDTHRSSLCRRRGLGSGHMAAASVRAVASTGRNRLGSDRQTSCLPGGLLDAHCSPGLANRHGLGRSRFVQVCACLDRGHTGTCTSEATANTEWHEGQLERRTAQACLGMAGTLHAGAPTPTNAHVFGGFLGVSHAHFCKAVGLTQWLLSFIHSLQTRCWLCYMHPRPGSECLHKRVTHITGQQQQPPGLNPPANLVLDVIYTVRALYQIFSALALPMPTTLLLSQVGDLGSPFVGALPSAKR